VYTAFYLNLHLDTPLSFLSIESSFFVDWVYIFNRHR
jgi:hypothetical protein